MIIVSEIKLENKPYKKRYLEVTHQQCFNDIRSLLREYNLLYHVSFTFYCEMKICDQVTEINYKKGKMYYNQDNENFLIVYEL
jgi:hypothetical protein